MRPRLPISSRFEETARRSRSPRSKVMLNHDADPHQRSDGGHGRNLNNAVAAVKSRSARGRIALRMCFSGYRSSLSIFVIDRR
jgi:hypothetical protein